MIVGDDEQIPLDCSDVPEYECPQHIAEMVSGGGQVAPEIVEENIGPLNLITALLFIIIMSFVFSTIFKKKTDN